MRQQNRLDSIAAGLKSIESYADTIYSMALDLDSDTAFRTVFGYQSARKAASFIVQGMRTAFGAINRLNSGDKSAVWTLALAGQMIVQSLDMIKSSLEPSKERIPPGYESLFDVQTLGLATIEGPLRQAAAQIRDVVGLPVWNAAKTPVTAIVGLAQA